MVISNSAYSCARYLFEPLEFCELKMSQRNIAGRKRKSSLLGNVPTTSGACPEVGSSSPTEFKYDYWSDEEQDLLFDWLGLLGNFEKWKCCGQGCLS